MSLSIISLWSALCFLSLNSFLTITTWYTEGIKVYRDAWVSSNYFFSSSSCRCLHHLSPLPSSSLPLMWFCSYDVCTRYTFSLFSSCYCFFMDVFIPWRQQEMTFSVWNETKTRETWDEIKSIWVGPFIILYSFPSDDQTGEKEMPSSPGHCDPLACCFWCWLEREIDLVMEETRGASHDCVKDQEK